MPGFHMCLVGNLERMSLKVLRKTLVRDALNG